MPIYEYECSRCSLRFEIKRGFNDEAKTICHHCGGEARRVFSPVPIFFKGPGFYVTDSAAEDRSRLGSKRDRSAPVDVGKRTESAEENKEGVLP